VKDVGVRGITRHGYFGGVDFRVQGECRSEQSDKQERELVAGRKLLLPPLSSVHVGPSYHHSNVLPAFATIAALATSDANGTITVPLADGMMTPSIIAMFPVVAREAALQAAGML
jgi:hypothetical protein